MSITWTRRGVLLSVMSSLKVLVSKQDLSNCRGAGVKRSLVTAICQPINCLACLHTSQHLDNPLQHGHFAEGTGMCLPGPAIHPSSIAACFWTPYTILVRALPFSTNEQAPEFWLSEDYNCGCHQRSALTSTNSGRFMYFRLQSSSDVLQNALTRIIAHFNR